MKKSLFVFLAIVMVLFGFVACDDSPAVVEELYDTEATVSINGNEWVVDRTAPKGFTIEDDKISITVDTTAANKDFYKYQGKKSFLDMAEAVGKWQVTTNLVLKENDVKNENYMSSIWLDVSTTTDKQGEVDWTIIEFVGGETPCFNWWDSHEPGVWNEISEVKPVAGNNEIRMTFDNGTFTLYVNGVEVSKYEKTADDETTITSSLIRSIILQVSNEKSGVSSSEFTANWTVPKVEYLSNK